MSDIAYVHSTTTVQIAPRASPVMHDEYWDIDGLADYDGAGEGEGVGGVEGPSVRACDSDIINRHNCKENNQV